MFNLFLKVCFECFETPLLELSTFNLKPCIWPCLEEEAHSTHLHLGVNGQVKVFSLPTI